VRGGAREKLLQLLAPALLIVVIGLVGSTVAAGTKTEFTGVLVNIAIVIALYVFIGNSGVISFGQIAFVAIGAFAAGVMTIPSEVKPTLLPELFPFIADHSVSSFESLLLAAGLGALVALVAGIALMRLNGLAAGIATFAVLEIVHNVLRFWEKIGPGAKSLALIPETTGLLEATLGALFCAVIAFLYQHSRSGRLLRAAREDAPAARAIGVNIHFHRLVAFTLSGALAGLAGGLLVHQIGSITTEQVYLQLTFITLAMLVVGGMGSLWGAVVGGALVSFLNVYLLKLEEGASVGPFHFDLPNGSTLLILGALMAAIVILRPSGITGSREVSPARWLPSRRSGAPSSQPPVPGPDAPKAT
jgi:branched-chain amino acid transport system permease protein